MGKLIKLVALAAAGTLGAAANNALAVESTCSQLPSWSTLKAALDASQATNVELNGGFGLQMWGVIVNSDGGVCAVAFSGPFKEAQWGATAA